MRFWVILDQTHIAKHIEDGKKKLEVTANEIKKGAY